MGLLHAIGFDRLARRSRARCIVCGEAVDDAETSIRIHGLVIHARCAVYRQRDRA